MDENRSRNLFLLLEQYKTSAVPYFGVLNRLKLQAYII